MSTDELIDSVINWGLKHGINNPIKQYTKVNEEVGEIAHELTRDRLHSAEMMDALGDTMVTLVILADILHFDIRDCLAEAYEQIKGREGKTVDGCFIKEEQ